MTNKWIKWDINELHLKGDVDLRREFEVENCFYLNFEGIPNINPR